MSPTRQLIVFGTRPEAIKMAPVVAELRRRPGIETVVCVTAQHRQMLDQVLDLFDLKPDFDLDIMRQGQTLDDIVTGVLTGLGPVLDKVRPDRVIVHGDTTTSFAGALAGFHRQIPVGHVEAGLRTGDLTAPWPEEMNRRFVDLVADLLWAPTEHAAGVLRSEGAAEANILVTGNTVVDALRITVGRLRAEPGLAAELDAKAGFTSTGRRMILVTGHRRENFDGGLADVCAALDRLATRGDVEIVWPVHPNPVVRRTVAERMQARDCVHLIPPQDYLAFTRLMDRCELIITDSGGIQEEAPSLGKPVLVTRAQTERGEALSAGTAILVGTDTARIVAEAERLLDDRAAYRAMAARANPFGDGGAAARIADSILARDGESARIRAS
jgi:UDP-N-acetylglucosamine 2-epimerase (non-hydrolysing)